MLVDQFIFCCVVTDFPGASFEELSNQNVSTTNEEEQNANEELSGGEQDDALLEDDIIKAALCALQTPSAAGMIQFNSLSLLLSLIQGMNEKGRLHKFLEMTRIQC